MILLIKIGEHDTDYTTHCKPINSAFMVKNNTSSIFFSSAKAISTSAWHRINSTAPAPTKWVWSIRKLNFIQGPFLKKKKKGMWCTDAQPIKPSKMNYRQKMVASFMYSKI